MHESEKWKWSCSVVSDSSGSHGLQPTRLLHPWDFPGKSTGVGCHFLLHPSPVDLLKPGIKPGYPALQANSLLAELLGFCCIVFLLLIYLFLIHISKQYGQFSVSEIYINRMRLYHYSESSLGLDISFWYTLLIFITIKYLMIIFHLFINLSIVIRYLCCFQFCCYRWGCHGFFVTWPWFIWEWMVSLSTVVCMFSTLLGNKSFSESICSNLPFQRRYMNAVIFSPVSNWLFHIHFSKTWLNITLVIYNLTFSVDQKLNSCSARHFWFCPSLGRNQMPFGTVVSQSFSGLRRFTSHAVYSGGRQIAKGLTSTGPLHKAALDVLWMACRLVCPRMSDRREQDRNFNALCNLVSKDSHYFCLIILVT